MLCARLEDVPRLSWPAGKRRIAFQPSRHQLLRLLDHLRAAGPAGGGEGRDDVALLAAEELVDRHAERLALDVVERDVDRRDRGLQHAAALEVLAAVHLLPERADGERVVADQELAIVLDGADDGLLAAGEAALAPAEDALVGLDLDEELVADADPGRAAGEWR